MREYETGSGTRVLETGSGSTGTPVVINTPSGGYNTGNGFGNGGILEAVVIASMFGGNRFGFGGTGISGDLGADTVIGQNVSNLRKDVADNAAEVHKLGNEIQTAFAQQTGTLASEFRNLDNKICETDKSAIEAKYEAKIQTLESTNSILDKIDDKSSLIKDQLYGMSTTMASEFCDLKHLMEHNTHKLSLQAERNSNETNQLIKDKFCELETKALENEIARLREQIESQRRDREAINNSLLMSQQTNSILNAVDSQLSRQTSQIVQFGTGNSGTSIPTSTNNTVN